MHVCMSIYLTEKRESPKMAYVEQCCALQWSAKQYCQKLSYMCIVMMDLWLNLYRLYFK